MDLLNFIVLQVSNLHRRIVNIKLLIHKQQTIFHLLAFRVDLEIVLNWSEVRRGAVKMAIASCRVCTE